MNKRSTVIHGAKPKKNGKALRSATAGCGIDVLEIQKKARISHNVLLYARSRSTGG
jgi:hypothetical protein